MKLLIVTQSVDKNDPVLGFFHGWLVEFAKQFEHIEVICLREGVHTLPDNVHVHSLGKEKGTQTAIAYALRFLAIVWKLRSNYDQVLVHMNQEYILLAGVLWKLLGKRMYLWRNHYAGSWRTDVAALFCTKVFCTSKHSYTAKYKKTVLMPVGVDTTQFSQDSTIVRASRSILFLGRIAPAKRVDMLIRALGILHRDGVLFTASIVGSPLPKDEEYLSTLKELARTEGLRDSVTFLPAVPNSETPDLYRAHEIFVNTSPSGMFDKTIFEAIACGCIVLAANEDFHSEAGEELFFINPQTLAHSIGPLLREALLVEKVRTQLQMLVQAHTLKKLTERLTEVILET